jgi:hypothetical protein
MSVNRQYLRSLVKKSELPAWAYDDSRPVNVASKIDKFGDLIIDDVLAIVSEVYKETPIESCGYVLGLHDRILKHFYKDNP